MSSIGGFVQVANAAPIGFRKAVDLRKQAFALIDWVPVESSPTRLRPHLFRNFDLKRLKDAMRNCSR